MPELTPKLGIKKPLGNETVSRASFNENWDIIDASVIADKGGVPSIQAGPDASKPAPGTAGRLYVAIDTQIIYRDTGTAWAKVGVVKWGDIDGKPSSFTPSIHGNEAHDPDLALASDLNAHLADAANPHQTTAEQVFALGGIPAGTSFPTNPRPYTLFFRTDEGKLYIYIS